MSRSQESRVRSPYQSSTLIKNQLISEAGHLFSETLQPNRHKITNSKLISHNISANNGSKIGEAARSRRPKQFAQNINQIINLVKDDLQQGNRDVKQVHKQQRKIADLMIPSRDSFLITVPQDPRKTLRKDSQRERRPISSYQQFPSSQLQLPGLKKAQSNQYQVPYTLKQSPANIHHNNFPVLSRIQSPENSNVLQRTQRHKNYLSDDAIALIQKIENRALHQIQILKSQKNQLLQLLNEEVSKHNQSKIRYVQLQTQFSRLMIYLENQGIRYVRNSIDQINFHQSRDFDMQKQQRFQPQRATFDFQQAANQEISPIYNLQKRSQNIENPRRRDRVSSHYVSLNKNSEKYTGFGLRQNMNQTQFFRDIQMRLNEAQNQAQLYKKQLQRFKNSANPTEYLQQNVFTLLNQGQRIREDTVRLLKMKTDISKIGGGARNIQLQRQLQQQEASKIAFFNDLKNFKDKYRRLEEQNKKLKQYSSPIIENGRSGQSRRGTNAYESMLEQMKRVTSG